MELDCNLFCYNKIRNCLHMRPEAPFVTQSYEKAPINEINYKHSSSKNIFPWLNQWIFHIRLPTLCVVCKESAEYTHNFAITTHSCGNFMQNCCKMMWLAQLNSAHSWSRQGWVRCDSNNFWFGPSLPVAGIGRIEFGKPHNFVAVSHKITAIVRFYCKIIRVSALFTHNYTKNMKNTHIIFQETTACNSFFLSRIIREKFRIHE